MQIHDLVLGGGASEPNPGIRGTPPELFIGKPKILHFRVSYTIVIYKLLRSILKERFLICNHMQTIIAMVEK